MSKDSKPSGTNPCACRFSSATGEQVVWCVVHDELREAVAELYRVFEMLDREGLEHRHGRCVMKIVVGLIGEHAMLRGRLEEVRTARRSRAARPWRSGCGGCSRS